MFAIHLPATLPAFHAWLVAHWPTARAGCQWQYGGRIDHLTWFRFCR